MTTNNPTVLWLTCGGTIDKIYYDAESDYRFGNPAVYRILQRIGIKNINVQSIIEKDSLDMTENDLEKIIQFVKDCSETRIAITHGTDTLTNTACRIGKEVKNKTIVCVGAFLPEVFKDTDSDFNLGFALAAAKLLPFGTYVAMNGEFFNANDVVKNRKLGRFEAKTTT